MKPHSWLGSARIMLKKKEGTDGKNRQTLINMAFRHCFAVLPSLLLLFKSFIFHQDLLTLVCLFFPDGWMIICCSIFLTPPFLKRHFLHWFTCKYPNSDIRLQNRTWIMVRWYWLWVLLLSKSTCSNSAILLVDKADQRFKSKT